MLMRGMLISFSDPNIGLVPTLVPFQYNPADVTRTLTVNRTGTPRSQGLRVDDTPGESYTLRLELDAVDAMDKPITGELGVQPLLAAIEAMLEPAASLGPLGAALPGAIGTALQGAVSALISGGGPIPAPSLPLVVLAWSAVRVVPVRIDSYTARETGFNAALLPVHATVDMSLTVLRDTDLTSDLKLANFVANAYQAARTRLAITGVAQGVELML
jgi:hypothetical protein